MYVIPQQKACGAIQFKTQRCAWRYFPRCLCLQNQVLWALWFFNFWGCGMHAVWEDIWNLESFAHKILSRNLTWCFCAWNFDYIVWYSFVVVVVVVMSIKSTQFLLHVCLIHLWPLIKSLIHVMNLVALPGGGEVGAKNPLTVKIFGKILRKKAKSKKKSDKRDRAGY